MDPTDPTLITSKSRIRAEIAEAFRSALEAALNELKGPADARPDFAFVTNEEAMKLLGLSRATLARYRADGTLPFHKLGSSIYYKLSDLEAVIEARRVTT